jgi:hypothetical protein
MTTGIEQKEQIEVLREWLEGERGNYQMALAVLKDPVRVRGFVKSIIAKVDSAMGYNAYHHPPVAAVAELSKLQERIGPILEDMEFLDEYEEKKKRYLDAIKAAVVEEPEGLTPNHSDLT